MQCPPGQPTAILPLMSCKLSAVNWQCGWPRDQMMGWRKVEFFRRSELIRLKDSLSMKWGGKKWFGEGKSLKEAKIQNQKYPARVGSSPAAHKEHHM